MCLIVKGFGTSEIIWGNILQMIKIGFEYNRKIFPNNA